MAIRPPAPRVSSSWWGDRIEDRRESAQIGLVQRPRPREQTLESRLADGAHHSGSSSQQSAARKALDGPVERLVGRRLAQIEAEVSAGHVEGVGGEIGPRPDRAMGGLHHREPGALDDAPRHQDERDLGGAGVVPRRARGRLADPQAPPSGSRPGLRRSGRGGWDRRPTPSRRDGRASRVRMRSTPPSWTAVKRQAPAENLGSRS